MPVMNTYVQIMVSMITEVITERHRNNTVSMRKTIDRCIPERARMCEAPARE